MQKLFVFDLDFTLWNAGGTWCDHTNPPFRRVHNHVEDSFGSRIVLYPDVPQILNRLKTRNYPMALASRTGEPSWAMQLLELFGINHFFAYKEIYPGSKITHFNNLKQQTGIPFSNMVFFDDEMRNIHDVGSLGVKAFFVQEGLSIQMIESYLK
ncbi:magnesium-dependent phosphatase-1 [Marinilabilia salmonicolor]|uniref:Magnesium-dependent phosphatase 1 n=1 Tax=Marinilabilia salmonicolor TaxID=989 RepID=A0A368V4M5_9BACT|nr:magnesium-dependent phosphatase-1 [Marinilabilia salmonicolor]RCW33961.1 magnesium-dependent phosphatase 1 [Marinilabilia salmonicolor]